MELYIANHGINKYSPWICVLQLENSDRQNPEKKSLAQRDGRRGEEGRGGEWDGVGGGVQRGVE